MKLVNQQVIKNANMKQVYNLIYREPGISRASLAKCTHLSKTAVSSIVDELISRRFIYDSGTSGSENSSVGRRPNSLQLQSEQYFVAVVVYEEDHLAVSLVDIVGTAAYSTQLKVTGPPSYVNLTKECIYHSILMQIKKEQLLGICVVVPAMIDPDKKEIFTTTLSLPSPPKEDIIQELKNAFPEFPVAVFNDTACLAYAEKVYTRIAEQDFAFINFDRGIGATLFIGNEMLGHACASYTQFGHYSIDPLGQKCSCGNRGCLELVIGEDSLKQRIFEAGGSPSLKRFPKITYANLGQSSLYGDIAAQKVIRDIAADFSFALSNLICMVHPKLIILGGKGKELSALFLEEIKKHLEYTGFRRMVDSVQIRYSMLDSSACCSGAMKYFFDIHYNFSQDMAGMFFIG